VIDATAITVAMGIGSQFKTMIAKWNIEVCIR